MINNFKNLLILALLGINMANATEDAVKPEEQGKELAKKDGNKPNVVKRFFNNTFGRNSGKTDFDGDNVKNDAKKNQNLVNTKVKNMPEPTAELAKENTEEANITKEAYKKSEKPGVFSRLKSGVSNTLGRGKEPNGDEDKKYSSGNLPLGDKNKGVADYDTVNAQPVNKKNYDIIRDGSLGGPDSKLTSSEIASHRKSAEFLPNALRSKSHILTEKNLPKAEEKMEDNKKRFGLPHMSPTKNFEPHRVEKEMGPAELLPVQRREAAREDQLEKYFNEKVQNTAADVERDGLYVGDVSDMNACYISNVSLPFSYDVDRINKYKTYIKKLEFETRLKQILKNNEMGSMESYRVVSNLPNKLIKKLFENGGSAQRDKEIVVEAWYLAFLSLLYYKFKDKIQDEFARADPAKFSNIYLWLMLNFKSELKKYEKEEVYKKIYADIKREVVNLNKF